MYFTIVTILACEGLSSHKCFIIFWSLHEIGTFCNYTNISYCLHLMFYHISTHMCRGLIDVLDISYARSKHLLKIEVGHIHIYLCWQDFNTWYKNKIIQVHNAYMFVAIRLRADPCRGVFWNVKISHSNFLFISFCEVGREPCIDPLIIRKIQKPIVETFCYYLL